MLMILSSCSSTRPILDDDVYMLKTAAIPLGENLLDETSYATYKFREDSNNPTTGYYNPSNESNRNNNNNRPFYVSPSFFYGGMMFPNNHMNSFGNYMMINPYSYYNPYAYYNPSFYGFNSFYNNPYINPYSGYGSGWDLYGANFHGNGFVSPYSSGFSSSTQGYVPNGNYVSGPRSTKSGYFSGTSRGGTQQLKFQITNNQSNTNGNTNIYSTVSRQTSARVSQVRNTSVGARPQYSSPERVTSRTSSSQPHYNNQQARPVQARGNSSYNSESKPNSSRTTTYNSPTRSSGSISTPSQRSNGGTTTSPSRSTTTPSSSGGRSYKFLSAASPGCILF